MRKLLLILLLAAPLPAQWINFGVKGGLPLNDAIQAAGSFKASSSNWTLGPMAEINLPFGFGLEANAMYRRVGYESTSPFNAASWSFPLLAKYKFPGSLARIYVSTGFNFRTIGDIPNLWDSNSKGFVLGAGIRYDLKLVKISPELRWTRWGEGRFNLPNPATDFLGTKRNQAEFLIGITF